MSDLQPPASEPSLIERLRTITGLNTPPPEPPSPPPPPYDAPPPVDKLMAGMRDGVTLAVACGIAGTVLGVALVLRAWAGVKPLAITASRKTREWSATAAARSRDTCQSLRQKVAALRARRVEKAALPKPPPSEPHTADIPQPEAIPDDANLTFKSALSFRSGELPIAPLPKPRESPRQPTAFSPIQSPDAASPSPGQPLAKVEPPLLEADTPPEPLTAPAPAAKKSPRALPRFLVLAPAALLVIFGALAAIPATRYAFTDWMGSGNARVVAGADGWIFLRSELAPAPPAPSLKATAAALRAQCENLVVLSLPSRAVIYSEKTTPSASGKIPRDPAVTATLAELTAAGASVLDLAPLLSAQKSGDTKDGPLFNSQDTHWSPRGMIYSASASAAHIQQQSAYATLPMNPALAIMEPVTAPAAPGLLVAEWQSQRSRARYTPPAHPLIRLLTPDKKAPLPDDPASQLVLLGGPALAAYDSAGVTLPDTPVPAAGFGRHLAFLLNTPVHLLPAATSRQSAEQWLEQQSKTKDAPRKIIVWLIEDADFLTRK